MNIDKNLFEERCYYEIYHILLTSEEKDIIPERIFNQIIEK